MVGWKVPCVGMHDIQTIAGTWQLIGAGASAALPTPHHVKFVFPSKAGAFEVRQDDDGQLPVEVVPSSPWRKSLLLTS